MKQVLENKLNMFDNTELHLAANNVIVLTRPALVVQEGVLVSTISSIRLTDMVIEASNKGVTVDKKVLKETVVQQVNIVGSAVFAFASKNNDNTMAESVNYSVSDLRRLSDENFPQVIVNINAKAAANIAALADYGILPATLVSLITAKDAYVASIGKPRNAVALKKTMNANLKKLFKQGSDLLKKEMDKTVLTLKLTQADFVSTYFNNRLIINSGTSNTVLKGRATDSVTGEELADVIVEIVEAERKTVTGLDGIYDIRKFRGGKFTIRFIKPGYADVVKKSVLIKQGTGVVLDVVMVKL